MFLKGMHQNTIVFKNAVTLMKYEQFCNQYCTKSLLDRSQTVYIKIHSNNIHFKIAFTFKFIRDFFFKK